MDKKEKTNLTLRINQEVVEKARQLGINLSSIIESMLKTENLAKDEEAITPTIMRESYRKVFSDILNIIKEWGIYLKIGEEKENITFRDEKGRAKIYPMDFYYYLTPKNKIEICDEVGDPGTEWNLAEDWPINNLFEPDEIIENLINELHKKAETNKEKIQKLSLLKNVLEKLKKEPTTTNSKLNSEEKRSSL